MQKHLIIFAKNPRIGRVKTRLARDIGKVAAWVFYRRMLSSIPKRLSADKRWTTWLAISPDDTKKACFPFRQIKWMKQGKGDLGARMGRPARTMVPGPFIVIGTDIPDIQPFHIQKAFKLLGRKEAVFGPCTDGGFWLVGLKRHGIATNPYKNPVRWSHPQTLNDCLANLKGAKVAMIDCLDDIDTLEDLQNWQKNKQEVS